MGRHCLECGVGSLIVCIADHRLGLVAAMETVCTECDAVLNSTLTSDRIEGSTAGNVPFFVVRQAVAASMDMGVGHAGLVKLCRFLDIKSLTHTFFTKHTHAICDANKVVVTWIFDEAANILCRVYNDIDSTIGADDTLSDLVNIVNRKVADRCTNVVDAVSIGEEMALDFVKSLPDSFHNRLKNSVKTMETMKRAW